MRLVAGVVVISGAASRLHSGLTAGFVLLHTAVIVTGILLLAGLWTPIAATLVAAYGIAIAISEPPAVWAGILLGTIGAALALLGPGAWSVDARLFGWKRIDLGDRRR